MKPVIHSTKHYVQFTRSTVAATSLNNQELVEAKESTTASTLNEVEEGAIVKAIFVELWLENSANAGSFVVTLFKNPGGVGTMTYANSISLGSYTNKKNVLYVTQGLTSNDGVGNPIPLLRQWFKIPKGKQRFGLGDELTLTISNTGTDTVSYCGFATYKELT